MSNKPAFIVVGFLVFGPAAYFSATAWSEGTEKASAGSAAPSALSRVNERYRETVKPIFEKKCFDCHSSRTHYPWYNSLPVIKQLIERDVREARADLDMSEDFPFIGKGTPTDYLDVLKDAVNDRSMPPWRYRIMHKDSALTDHEREVILKWVEESGNELAR